MERANQRAKETQRLLDSTVGDLTATRSMYAAGVQESDKLLEQTCVALDTLIEFILLNHGEIPAKLADIIAARQEARIARAAPQFDVITKGVQPDDVALVTSLPITKARKLSAEDLEALLNGREW